MNFVHHEEYQYLILLDNILNNGHESKDRTGVGTKRLFGAQMRFDLSKGFPLLTTKKVFWKGVVGELLWFLSGSTNNNDLVKKYGVHIWDEWSRDGGDLGPVYGHGWRSFMGPFKDKNGNLVSYHKDIETKDNILSSPVKGIDQIANVIEQIKTNPDSRRMIVCSWNAAELSDTALPPCHCFFQFVVIDGKLHCHTLIRSNDVFLGAPFNIASYALLTHMIAQVTGLKVGDLVYTISDAHLYMNHIDQAKEQLQREPFPFPKLHLNFMVNDIDKFTIDDISLVDYQSHATIKAPIAI